MPIPVDGFTESRAMRRSRVTTQCMQDANLNAPNSASILTRTMSCCLTMAAHRRTAAILFPFRRPHRRERAGFVRPGQHQRAQAWTFNLGFRGDIYNGLTTASQAEPRVGYRLQHSEDQYRAAYLLCAHPGDTVQRKPGALQHWMRRPTCSPALGLLRRALPPLQSRLSQ